MVEIRRKCCGEIMWKCCGNYVWLWWKSSWCLVDFLNSGWFLVDFTLKKTRGIHVKESTFFIFSFSTYYPRGFHKLYPRGFHVVSTKIPPLVSAGKQTDKQNFNRKRPRGIQYSATGTQFKATMATMWLQTYSRDKNQVCSCKWQKIKCHVLPDTFLQLFTSCVLNA